MGAGGHVPPDVHELAPRACRRRERRDGRAVGQELDPRDAIGGRLEVLRFDHDDDRRRSLEAAPLGLDAWLQDNRLRRTVPHDHVVDFRHARRAAVVGRLGTEPVFALQRWRHVLDGERRLGVGGDLDVGFDQRVVAEEPHARHGAVRVGHGGGQPERRRYRRHTAPAGGSPVNVTLGGWLATIVIDTGADAVTVPLLSTARAVSENVPVYGLFHVYA